MENKNPLTNLLLLVFLSHIFFFQLSHQQISISLLNPRLLKAYVALQAWKLRITSDPSNVTSNWHGPDVCSYDGVFCAPAPDDPHLQTVAGIDLNHANIAGTLPEELGLLSDLALFHINSNRFCGTLPFGFKYLQLLHELDISNNQFSGPFPEVVLWIRNLKFLDIRFNSFCGIIPAGVFDLQLDALFVNDNKFTSALPENFANSPVSVFVTANNDLKGCLPPGLGRMGDTIEEIILMNSGLKGCLPEDLGELKRVKVFDVSSNQLVGTLPATMGKMQSLEQLNVADNKLSGQIPASVCALPNVQNFTYSSNFFSEEPPTCLRLPGKDDRLNCIPGRPLQRSTLECEAFSVYPVDCGACACSLKAGGGGGT